MKKIIFLLLWASSPLAAETTKTVFNPFTGKLDYITALSSNTLPSGSTQYIQNTLSPTTTTQTFSVQQGSFSATGFIMTDPTGCQWNTTIAATGALVTTLIPGSCPAVAQFRPCTTGMSLGLLLSITCP